MNMKSCVTISLVEEARGGPFVLWDSLEQSIGFAAELGYDAVEIFSPSVEALNLDTLGGLLDSAGIKLAALGTGAGWVKHQLQLADADAGKREQARAFVRTIIDAAGQFGAMAIIGSMQGRSGADVDAATAKAYLAEALEDGGQHAQQYGVPLIYEPLNRYETNQCCTVEQGVDLLQSLSTDNVRLLCDLFHMNIEEADRRRRQSRTHSLRRLQPTPSWMRAHAVWPHHGCLESHQLRRLSVCGSIPLAGSTRSCTSNHAGLPVLDWQLLDHERVAPPRSGAVSNHGKRRDAASSLAGVISLAVTASPRPEML